VEDQWKPNVYYVAVMKEQGQIFAVAPCYRIDDPGTFDTYNVRDLIADGSVLDEIGTYLSAQLEQEHAERVRFIHEHIGPQLFPNLLCTAMQGYASGPLFHQDLDDQSSHEVAQTLVDAVVSLGQALACPVTAFLYVEKSNPVTRILERGDFLHLAMEAGACLQLSKGDFNKYLLSLSSRRRLAIRREIKRFQKSDSTVAIKNLTELPTQRLASLLQNVQAKHQNADSDVKTFEEYIEKLKQIPLSNRVFVAYSGNQIAGFALFYQYRKAFFARVVGFDYCLLKDDFCYFNLLFYEPISSALQQGLYRIDYGLGALEGKLGRGCSVVPLYGYFYVQDPTHRETLRASVETVSLIRQQINAFWQEKFSREILTEYDVPNV